MKVKSEEREASRTTRETARVTKALLGATDGQYDSEIVSIGLVSGVDAYGSPTKIWQAIVRITVPDRGTHAGVGTAAVRDHVSPIEAEELAFCRAAAQFGIRVDDGTELNNSQVR